MKIKKLSILIPAYNEENGVAESVRKVKASINKTKIKKYENKRI